MLSNSEELRVYYKVWFSYLFWEMKVWYWINYLKIYNIEKRGFVIDIS